MRARARDGQAEADAERESGAPAVRATRLTHCTISGGAVKLRILRQQCARSALHPSMISQSGIHEAVYVSWTKGDILLTPRLRGPRGFDTRELKTPLTEIKLHDPENSNNGKAECKHDMN